MIAAVDALLVNPLTTEQLWLWRRFVDCPAQSYRSYGIAKVAAPLQPSDLRRAIEEAIRNHESLRSLPVNAPGMVYPVLMEDSSVLPVFHDMGTFEGDAEAAIDRMVHELAGCRFSFEEQRLIHAFFGRLAYDAVLWGLAIPAFIADRASVVVLLRDISAMALCREGAPTLGRRTAIGYGSIFSWREQVLAAPEAAAGKLFWRERLNAHNDAIADIIVSDSQKRRVRSESTTNASGIQKLAVNLPCDLMPQYPLADEATAKCRSLAAWYVLLWKLRNCPQSEFSVAVHFDGRTMTDFAGTVGPLARFLPVTVAIGPGRSMRQLGDDLSRSLRDANEWQDCFALEDYDDPAVAAIRSHDFGFEFIGADEDDVRIEVMRQHSRCEPFKLKLEVSYRGPGCTAALYYDSNHFEQHHAKTLLDTYCYYLEQAARDDALRLRDLQWRLEDEAVQLLVARDSSTGLEHVPDRLRRIAAQYPDRIALACDGLSLSYARMSASVAALVQKIGSRSLPQESCIAVVGAISFDTLLGLVAVLQAGHCFVYLDPQHPPTRIARVLRENRVKLILMDGSTCGFCPDAAARILDVDAEAIDISVGHTVDVEAQPSDDVRNVHPRQLAYVAYTSGSTGEPNGVMISQASLASQMDWLINQFGFCTEDSWLLKTPLVFDAAVWEWLTPLCVGGTLVLGPAQLHLHPKEIATTIRDHRVTVLQIVPNLMRPLMSDAQPEDLASLRYLFAGGESLPSDVCSMFGRRFAAQLINLYGPTETTINATWWACPRDWPGLQETSIGAPVEAMTAHVLDKLGHPLPRDFVGELYLAGSGVARGYAHKPRITAERFVPFPAGTGERMYRTGDLVSQDASGKLLCWGRVDHQVKLRGYRIELGEIESLLCAHRKVKTSAACIGVLGADGATGLIAYVVAKDPVQRPCAEELREYLRARMPQYMVPALIVVLDGLPLKSTGKVDRGMLASREFVDLHRLDSYAAPQTNTQRTLCEIWQHLLGVETVGINDDFMQLGGQSLLVMRLVAHIQQRLGIEVSPRLIFDLPLLRDFAARIDQLLASGIERPSTADVVP